MKTTVCVGIVLLLASRVPAQNLFVAEYTSGNIYEYTPDGVRSTFASGLIAPAGLTFDSSGDLFVGSGAGVIIEITPDGTKSVFASGMADPNGLAFNSQGDLFAADPVSGNVYEITPNGTMSIFASGLRPNNVVVDSAGNLFVANGGNSGPGNIIKITPDGKTKSIFASGFSIAPIYGLAFDSAGNLFVSDNTEQINKITPAGTVIHFVGGVAEPIALAFNSAGYLFAADINTGQITEISPNGTESTFATGLNEPQGLAFQPVPEPASLGLLAVGTAVLVFVRCRQQI